MVYKKKRLDNKESEIQLEFDFHFDSKEFSRFESYRDGAQEILSRLLPKDLLDKDSLSPFSRVRFADNLPFLKVSNLDYAPCTFSMLLLCKHRKGATSFFYEMVSRWLLPGKKTNVDLFFTSDVRLSHLSDEPLSVAEIVLYIRSMADLEIVKKNLKGIETEIRLGVSSNYHARRILEFKGLSTEGKTALIQEKIGSLVQSHSKEFDQGIFTQMQHFLIKADDGFKRERDYHHISRIISNLYSQGKLLKQNCEAFPSKRHIQLKFFKTQLKSTSAFSNERHVLGVLVGLNFLSEHEVFEEGHFVKAIQKCSKGLSLVEGSYFLDRLPEQSLQALYLEVEKRNGCDFTFDEVKALKENLPVQVKNHIEKLTHPIFMPRNEEEVLRNVMALSKQLRYVNDAPQVTITFDEQKGENLSFTIVLVRIKEEKEKDLSGVFKESNWSLPFIPDRVRKVGVLRKRYEKEATVFRTLIKSSPFLRKDSSVDLYEARNFLFKSLQSALGDVRDFNGGMIVRQGEHLSALRDLLGPVAEKQNLLLEKFYYAINPIEMRTSCDVEHFKQLFLLLLQASKSECIRYHKKGGDFLYKQDSRRAMAVISVGESEKKKIQERISSLKIFPHQLVFFSVDIEENAYTGYLLLSEDKALQADFLKALELQ